MAQKTIKLTSKLTGQEYKYEGTDDTHTFNLPYGEYDVEITENGYQKKTHSINHQGKNTYSYTLWIDKDYVQEDKPIKTIPAGGYTTYQNQIYITPQFSNKISKIVANGKEYIVTGQTNNSYGQTVLTVNENVDKLNANLELYGNVGGVDDTHYLIITLSIDQFEVDGSILYGIDPSLLTTTPSYIESNGKRYQVKSMDEIFGRKRLILDQTYQGSGSVDVYA